MERSEVPSCSECTLFEDNPMQYVLEQACPSCPWGTDIDNPLLDRLLGLLAVQDAGGQIGRYELRQLEWRLLAAVKAERERIYSEKARERAQTGTDE